MRSAVAALMALSMLTGCQDQSPGNGQSETALEFPDPFRPVSKVGANRFATETQRDSVNEAQTVMDLAEITPGMTVADIGAGEGYYTIRLAERVGSEGRVLAQDIDDDVVRELGLRVERERLDNVSIKLGAADDPRLPSGSFDRIFLVHMYHEVTEPYAFLWRMWPALRDGGRILVVDVDRPTDKHGIPPELLFCEFRAVGFRLTKFVRKPELQGYYAQFELVDKRPKPADIEPCNKAEDFAAKVR